MRTQMYSDRDHYIGLDRRKLTFDCSVSRTLPQRDQPPSVCESCDLITDTVVTAARTGDGQNEVYRGEPVYKNKKMLVFTLFRSGMLFFPYLAIMFLLAATPSVVRAQAQNDTTTGPINSAALDPGASETTGAIPTTASTPIGSPDASDLSAVTPSNPMPTPAFVVNITTPTIAPTSPPTKSMMPSVTASKFPSSYPTVSFEPTTAPTAYPTDPPTWVTPSVKETKFRQEFQVGNEREFNEDELNLFETLYQRYTVEFSPQTVTEVENKIATTCTVDKQTFLIEVGDRQLHDDTDDTVYLRQQGRHLQGELSIVNIKTLNVDYTMKYESSYYNVTNYPKLFQNWTTNNLNVVMEQMQFLNVDVISVNIPKRIVVSTPSPSHSSSPSITPTSYPTISPGPSVTSTDEPIGIPSNIFPTATDEENGFGSFNIIIISASVIIAFSIIAIGLFLYYRKRRTKRQDDFGANGTKRISQPRVGSEIHSNMRWADSSREAPNPSYGTPETKAYGSYGRHSDAPSRLADAVASPPGSLVSSQSLISRGNSMGGDSRDEEDTAHILVDEFDQYKDQNLEKMRADIEDLPECDGMMSQAVAKALIDQDDETFTSTSYWGGDHDMTAPQIEASALGLVLDWLKRNSKVSDREKREMMQEQLNKMTASVLHKVIGPDDATRTIHECAVLLGLKLASELSATTILVSGMSMKATEADIRRTFSVFGDVAVAAIAPNERGFGILRFKSNNAASRTMGRFRKEKILVEDVAVQLIAIKAGLNVGNAEDNYGMEII